MDAAEPGWPGAVHVPPGERTTGERLVGDEGDAQFTAHIQHAVDLRLPVQQRELHLVGREWNATLSQCRVGHTHLCRGVVADSDRPDPSRLDGIRHQRHQLRDVHTSRREVVLIEIDFIPSQTGKARVERGGQVVGAPERARGNFVATTTSRP